MTVPLTDSCTYLGCTNQQLICHRCGTHTGVTEQFIVTNPRPCLAGTTMKAGGRFTHSCETCRREWNQLIWAD